MRLTGPVRRGLVIAALILLALGLDAVTGFNILMAGGCMGFIVLQLIAMTAGVLVAVAGLAVWLFSRFRSENALYAAVCALALIMATLVLRNVLDLIGLACIV